jgi:beta-glucosidase/6-phospho-beta-glucosidase/beta-galactosidase
MVENKAIAGTCRKHYELFETDVQLMKSMGLQHYQFSIAWSASSHQDSSKMESMKGILFYNRLIDTLLHSPLPTHRYVVPLGFTSGIVNATRRLGWENDREAFAYANVTS